MEKEKMKMLNNYGKEMKGKGIQWLIKGVVIWLATGANFCTIYNRQHFL